ncbi:MAG: hypothetical protein ACREVY_10430 [Gammaproteobacteria bacterium]
MSERIHSSGNAPGDDGTVVDTDRASDQWEEKSEWNGSNHIGRSSGSQWHDQALYRSRKGRYYVEHRSRVQGQRNHVEWVSPEEAARWLIYNDYELTQDLGHLEDEATE